MVISKYFSAERPLLLCAASSAETELVLSVFDEKSKSSGAWQTFHFGCCTVMETGVGKSNAAGAVAVELLRAEVRQRKYASVLVIGIGGGLSRELALGDAVLADSCVLVDEGTPLKGASKWRSLEESGFAQLEFSSRKSEWWHELAGHVDRVGKIATVSTISGFPEIAEAYEERSHALVEAMEGAAVAQVCARFNVDFAELRSISNICGNSDREENPWDIGKAFARLKKILERIR
ncbi:MAG: futalosine hydrolase [Candidatus Obscuribacterales bacterium]|nr:futalosine hydrolase [Candidatus Obscuribacterales bacterium]